MQKYQNTVHDAIPKVIFMYIWLPCVQKRTYRKISFLSKQIIFLALFDI